MTVYKGKGLLTYRQDVDHTHDHGQDAGGDYNSPECQSKSLLAHRGRVQVAQHCHPKDHHDSGKSDEACFLAEQWPLAIEIAAEDWELRYDEEDCFMLALVFSINRGGTYC